MGNRRGSLLLRGMRWRLGASLLTVLASTIAVAAAVLGPLYLHTAGDSVLRRTVSAAPVQETGLTLPDYSGQGDPYVNVTRAAATAERLGGHPDLFDAPIVSVIAPGTATARIDGHGPYGFIVFSRTGACRMLHFVAGSCDLNGDGAVIDARSARRLGVTVGDVLPEGRPLRITGVYSLPDLAAPYWWGEASGEFLYGTAFRHIPQLDPIFVSSTTALAVSGSHQSVAAQVPLAIDRVGLSREGALSRAVGRITAAVRADGIVASTGLPSVLSDADDQRGQLTTIVAVAAVQLVVLAVWVLASLIVRSGDARQAEARVARLRGLPTRSMLWVTAAEPGMLCLVGTVLGVAAAVVAVVIARASLLQRSSSIAFDGWTIAALALTVLAIVGALGIGTVRLLRSTQLSAPTAGSSRRTSIVSVVVDVVLVVLAIAALIALATTGALSGHTDPLAAAGPGLIALGAAVLAVHLILSACRLGILLSRDSPRVAAFLALRQTVRRPGVLRQARVLVIALCLGSFAIAAWSIARRNRSAAADFQVGAPAVLSVAPQDPNALQQAVNRTDPKGRWAMPVTVIVTPSSRMLAVEADRLAAVAAWPRGVSPHSLAQVARVIDPPTAPEIRLPDAPLGATADVGASGVDAARIGTLELAAWVFNPVGGTSIIDLGGLRPGVHAYGASLGFSCPAGCRLAGIGLVPEIGSRPPGSGSISVDLTGPLRSGTRSLSSDLTPGGWRSGTTGVSVTAGDGRLALRVSATAIDAAQSANGATTPPMATVADHPVALPILATQELEAANAAVVTRTLDVSGLDGNTISVVPAESAPALPNLGANGSLIDLDLLARTQVDPTSPDASQQVWLGAAAPADAVARLRAAGLHVTGVQRASTVLAQMQRTGPALADDFLLVASIAALLVAAASTLGALGATTRERATELTSLRIAGVPRPVLMRALGLETAILLVTALCGTGAGILAAVLAVPSLPERAVPSLAPLQFGLPLGAVALVTVAVIAAIALVSTSVIAVLRQRMSPSLLRTAPDDVSL